MKIVDLLERADGPPISFEIIPPRRGGSAKQIFELIDTLVTHNPPYIDMTSHSAECSYEDQPDGTIRRRVKRKRPGTLGLCAAIKYRYGIETVPHLLCSGFTREETEDALIELKYLGIENVMAVRGDDTGYRKPLRDNRTRNAFAVDMVKQIVEMNNGKYLLDLPAEASDFCIGVGGYPEKHVESPNSAWCIEKLKEKVAAGAHWVTTQMFFDNPAYFKFIDKCRQAGITVPIIPGVKVLTKKQQLISLPKNFHVCVPESLAADIDAAKDDKQVCQIGIQWAIRQTIELFEKGVPSVHFFIMQSSMVINDVVDGLVRKGWRPATF